MWENCCFIHIVVSMDSINSIDHRYAGTPRRLERAHFWNLFTILIQSSAVPLVLGTLPPPVSRFPIEYFFMILAVRFTLSSCVIWPNFSSSAIPFRRSWTRSSMGCFGSRYIYLRLASIVCIVTLGKRSPSKGTQILEAIVEILQRGLSQLHVEREIWLNSCYFVTS